MTLPASFVPRHADLVGLGEDYLGEWYLPVNGGSHRLYVLERGSGPVVLSVHGGPGHDHGYLRDALAHLEDGHRVVYFDQRGSLRSPMPLECVGFDAVVDDFPALVAELGGPPVRVLAHSMGCVLVAAALSRYQNLFAEMLLVNPAPLRAGQPRPSLPERPEVAEELARRGLDHDPASARERTWAWRIRFAASNLYHVDRWTEMAGGGVFFKPDAAAAIRAGLPADYDYVPALRDHVRSVTIAVGDHDNVDPGGEHATAASGGALRTVVVPQAGHNLWIDQPAEFAEITRQALP